MPSVRIATWNTKQGVAPRQKAPALWEWISRVTEADILVLTEAKPPKEGLPPGWNAIFTPGGVGARRNYGTIIAARGSVEICRADFARSEPASEYPNPATTFAVEVLVDGEIELVLLGAYGLLSETQNGLNEFSLMVNEYADLIAEYGDERFVMAGDFNLWPGHLLQFTKELGFVDVTGQRKKFPKLHEPSGGSRIWTHKNGAKHTNGARQELDYIFVSEDLQDGLRDIQGGVDDFPDAWDMSDHAPVATTINF